MFTTIFSHFNDLDSLKAVATEIATQVNKAYAARAKEITDATKKVNKTPAPTSPTPPPAPATPVATTFPTANATPSVARVSRIVRTTSAAPKTPFSKSEPKATEADNVEIAITDKEAIKKLNLKFCKYSDYCWVLYGDTKPLKTALGKLHGSFNSAFKDPDGSITGTPGQRFAGWRWRNDDVPEVAKALGIDVKIA